MRMRCIELLLLLLVSAWPAAFASEGPGCSLVRSMADTYSGPDVGSTWGQLLLMGIDFADAKRGVAAGFNDPTEIRFNGRFSGLLGWTEDGGRTFTVSKVGGRGQSKGPLWTVRHASGDTFWAAGYGGLVMRSDDAGRTWKEHHCGRGYPSVQADFRDADHGLLAMGDNGILFATDDGGGTWRRADSGTSRMLYAVDFTSPLTGYACGKGVLLKTADGGKSWIEIKNPSFRDDIFSDIRFANERLGLMVGDYGMIYRTEDGGRSWRALPQQELLRTPPEISMRVLAPPVNAPLHRIDVADEKTFHIAGSRGTILRSTDGGITWDSIKAATRNNVYAISRGVAVGPTGDPRKEGNWGLPYENFNPPFTKGSFAVWKNGTFKIKVDGVTKVKSVRIIGGPPDAKPPQFSTSSGKNSLTVKIKGKDPLLHPMLVFEAE